MLCDVSASDGVSRVADGCVSGSIETNCTFCCSETTGDCSDHFVHVVLVAVLILLLSALLLFFNLIFRF